MKGKLFLALVSSNLVSDLWPVNSADSVGDCVVRKVLHLLWGSVVVIVSTFPVVTEAVSVLNTKI